MGLDMYLKASKYIGGWEHSPDGERETFKKVLRAAGLPTTLACDGAPSLEVQVNVAYWRKANAIHKWFVDNVQNGVDECQTSYVSRNKLKELFNLCHRVIAEKDASLLPPASGSFFGATAVDEGYWRDVENTMRQLRAILAAPALTHSDFYYRASW